MCRKPHGETKLKLLRREAYGQLNFMLLHCVFEPSHQEVVSGKALEGLELDRESVPRFKNDHGPFI